MKNREKTVEKRTQQDYTMAFKLGIVSRVEKGSVTKVGEKSLKELTLLYEQ